MAETFEMSMKRLEALAVKYRSSDREKNEAETRFKIIDLLFFDCLGWEKDDVEVEKHADREWADYTFSAPRDMLVVEAKREGVAFVIPTGLPRGETTISAITQGNSALRKAVEQASRYCQKRGVPYGVVTNGHQMLAFVANRQDGVPPMEGKCIVFTSLDDMHERFTELWNLLSKTGVEQKYLANRLLGDAAPAIPPKLAFSVLNYPGTKIRNVFQSDLKILSDMVLEDIVRLHELEEQFLKECYCQSGALSQYALTSREVLQTRYAAVFEGEGGPTLQKAVGRRGVTSELAAGQLTRRPILVIGDVGVGKSTFIRHLVRIDAAAMFRDAIALFVDLGTQGTLATELQDFVLQQIEEQLRAEYDIDIYERNFVHGIYHLEIERFRSGIHGDLRESSPQLYREKEVAYLETLVHNRAEHVRKSVEHLVRGRQVQVVLFIDNADQRTAATQEEAFLVGQEIAANWPVAVFVTLRPETFHRSLRTGALSGYHPNAFTVSPPRIDLVVEKRLAFARRIARGEIPILSHQSMRAKFTNLDAVISAFMQSIMVQKHLHEFVDHISGGNVRLALDLVKDFFGSGHVDTPKIVEIYERKGDYTVPLHEFLRAVLYGDAVHYDPTQSPIANLFDVSTLDESEHFLLPACLNVLSTWSGPGTEAGFVETTRLYSKMQGYGFTPDQIDAAIVRAHRHKLVETSARKSPQIGHEMPASLRATTVGIYHVRRLSGMFTYIDAVVIDTPVLSGKHRSQIHDLFPISERLQRGTVFVEYLDRCWEVAAGKSLPFHWPEVSVLIKADIQRIHSVIARRRGEGLQGELPIQPTESND